MLSIINHLNSLFFWGGEEETKQSYTFRKSLLPFCKPQFPPCKVDIGIPVLVSFVWVSGGAHSVHEST